MDTRLLLILVVQLAGSLLPTAAQDLEGCGETKGCFKWPSTCTGDNCKAFVTWEPMGDDLFNFTLKGKTTGWVAFGLRRSNDSGMSPADVYACTKGSTEILRSENVVPYDSLPRAIPPGAVTTTSYSIDDTTITCQFTRKANVIGDSTFYDIANNKFFILLDVGDTVNADGTIAGHKHTERWASQKTFQLSDVSDPNLDGCGVTKGCYQKPDSCTGDDCMAFVTWKPIGGGKFRFSMRASGVPSLAWVAFGLGVTTGRDRMSPADVYACTSNQEVKRSFNVRPLPAESSYDSLERDIPAGTVDVESVVSVDNVISCQFTRKESTVGDAEFYDISGENQYHIMLCVGDIINPSGSLQGHEHTKKWHTREPLILSDVKIPVTTPKPPVTSPDDLADCGKTKGCFKQPSECTGSDCLAYVTWQTQSNGDYQFTLMGNANGYVAFGLRPGSTPVGTSGMVPAEVYACTNKAELKRSENVNEGGLNSNPMDILVDSISKESFTGGMIRCQFDRKPFIDGNAKFYNISEGNEYFILLALGESIQPDGTIKSNYHGTSRWTTSKAIVLTTEIPQEDKSGIRLRKAHASLMVIAWIGFASIGITLARFFKPMWPDSKLFGTKIWFAIHRMFMVTCVVFFSVAFILIFVAVGGFVQSTSSSTIAHAVLGIIVTVFGILNPIMAIFRPHPGTPNRPVFNWAHWFVGTSAHSMAFVTVFLGIGYQSSLLAGLKQYVFWVMVVFVGFHTLIWILFEVQRCMTESQGRQNDIPLQGSGGNSTDNLADPDGPPATTPISGSGESKERQIQEAAGSQVDKEGSTAKNILLFVYILGVGIMTLFLLINFIIA